MRNIGKALVLPALLIMSALTPQPASADKLDDIIKAGEVRCGVMLDFAPVGYRDASNNPVGYDVEFCNDLAKELGVKPIIVETPSADRIPALLSDRVDISISSATNSLERAKVVEFSVPYQVWDYSVVVAQDSPIQDFPALKGRTVGTGLPVHALLGGAYRTSFDQLTNLYHKQPEAMAEACKAFVVKGFKGLKVKVGDVLLAKGWNRGNLEAEIAKLEAALAVVPRDVYVDADANQGWCSAQWTVSLLRQFSHHDNLSIEQPLPYADLEGAAFVRRHAGVPLIMDESVWSPEAVMQLLRMGACDRIVLKLNRVGGFYPAQQIIAMCEAAGVGVSVDTNPYTLIGDTASCQIAATIRTAYPVDCEGHVSFLDVGEPNPFSGGISFRDRRAWFSDAPGLGVEVDWKKLEALGARAATG